jgi:hypothetical protein
MPILDAKTVFSREVALSGASVGTVIKGTTVWTGAIEENKSQIVDQEKAGDAVGQELTVKCVVGGTAAVGGTSASTVQFKLQTSDTTTDGDFQDLLLSPAIKVKDAIPGTELACFRVPAGSKRYLRTTITVGGATVTGVFSVYATRDL